MLTADFSRGLPDLRAGVYRHWKGRYYLVLGYAHDANADTLRQVDEMIALGERAVVVYVGLELVDANTGPRLAVRTAEDFFALVCGTCGEYWECHADHAAEPAPVPRFEYVGAEWYGRSIDPDTSPGHPPAPDTAPAPTGDQPDPGRPQWPAHDTADRYTTPGGSS